MRSAESASARAPLSLTDIRRLHGAAHAPRPLIYWTDMLASAAIGWTAFALSVRSASGSEAIGWAAISTLALLRGMLFIHELTHVRRGALPGFELGWHLVLGLPLLVPSLMYRNTHNAHHRNTIYGTPLDPEYAPISSWSRFHIVRFVLGTLLLAPALLLRWSLLTPLSRWIPPLRRFVVERASTLVINPDYRRPMPEGEERRRFAIQEAAEFVVSWAMIGAIATGLAPLRLVLTFYAVGSGILILNQIRTLVAHGYQHHGEPLGVEEQLADSINVVGGSFVSALIAPVGLRYHALHHLLPAVPYHALGAVHRDLQARLPRDAPYLSTVRAGIFPALRDLWSRAGMASQHETVAAG